MSKFYNFSPEYSTEQDIEQFENNVIIRHNNQMLLGTVMSLYKKDQWNVAFGYNQSRHHGIHGHENMIEVKYSYSEGNENIISIFRSDSLQESSIGVESFTDTNDFVRYVIMKERMLLNRPA